MAGRGDNAPTDEDLLPQGPIAVIGNGRADSSPSHGCVLRFRFNAQIVDLDPDLDVNVRMVSGADGRAQLKVDLANGRSGLNVLEERLNLELPLHRRDLGCLPSTGYALIHALWATRTQLQITGVRFDPSLTRPRDLGRRKPLPQAFHNWLGERRTTFQRWLAWPQHAWEWGLVSNGHKGTVQTNAERAADGNVHWLDVLDCVREAARTGQMTDFASIGRQPILPTPDLLCPHPWIMELENGFYLNRHQSVTQNWWLFDQKASELAEAIASNLRRAQHQAFLRVHAPSACARPP